MHDICLVAQKMTLEKYFGVVHCACKEFPALLDLAQQRGVIFLSAYIILDKHQNEKSLLQD